MKIKSTPPPWKVDEDDCCKVLGPDGLIVAMQLFVARGSDVGAANSQLIASAPELLDAAEKFVAYYNWDLEDFDPLKPLQNQMRAVVAKARGEMLVTTG